MRIIAKTLGIATVAGALALSMSTAQASSSWGPWGDNGSGTGSGTGRGDFTGDGTGEGSGEFSMNFKGRGKTRGDFQGSGDTDWRGNTYSYDQPYYGGWGGGPYGSPYGYRAPYYSNPYGAPPAGPYGAPGYQQQMAPPGYGQQQAPRRAPAPQGQPAAK